MEIGKEYSVGLGMEYGNRDKLWVNEQSSIIGKNSANITVEGKINKYFVSPKTKEEWVLIKDVKDLKKIP